MPDAITCEQKLDLLTKEFDSFTYIVSHDIKAPLRAVNNLTEWITEDLESGNYDDVKDNLNILRTRVARLQKMMDALSDISKVHKQQFLIEKYDIPSQLESLKQNYLSSVQFNITGDLISFDTCMNPLNTVLTNIMDNGIKFNEEESKKIDLHIENRDEYVVFKITDNGIGLSSDYIEKIFGMFYTLVPKDKTKDIGAGLTLVKKILDTIGGKIEVESKKDEGSTFTVFWPKKINENGKKF